MTPLQSGFRNRGIALDAVSADAWTPHAFTHADDEHVATRRALGLFDFSFMGLYEVRGPEARRFLGKIQSRALGPLRAGRVAYTLLIEDSGAVFIDATLWCTIDDTWWLFTGRRSDARWLAQRARGYGVTLRDRSGEFAVLALQGPKSGHALARIVGADEIGKLPYFGFVDTTLGNIPARIGRLGYSGELGYEILVAAKDGAAAWVMLLHEGASLGIRECGFAAANSLRIESGFLLFGREITGGETATELGLARLMKRPERQLDHGSRRLVGLEISSPAASPRACQGLPLARASSECESPLLRRRIALGFVPAQAAWPGTTVRLADARTATVARLPFYDPARRLPRVRPL